MVWPSLECALTHSFFKFIFKLVKKKSHDIIITKSSKLPNRACDMAKPVKALVTRPDKLSSSPRTHVIKDKISHKLSSDLHKSTVEVK